MIQHVCDRCGKAVESGGLMVIVRTYPVVVYGDSSQPFSQRDTSPADVHAHDRHSYLCPKCVGEVYKAMGDGSDRGA